IGSNMTEAHPVVSYYVKQAVQKGAKMIVCDPRKVDIAHWSDLHVPLSVGTDVPFLNGLINEIIKNGWHDEEFMINNTENPEELKEWVKEYPVEVASKICGVPEETMRKVARMLGEAKKVNVIYCLGITEHTTGTDNVKTIANLQMVLGHIGKKGCGVNPLRGQNNVQGAADMGCQPHLGAGYMNAYDPEVNKQYEGFYKTPVPLGKGLKIPEMFEASIEGKLKALWLMGEDVVQTDPNTNKVIAAMENLELLVLQEIFLTETAKYATVILPGATFLEKSGTYTNGERRIQRVQKVVEPLEGTKSDGQIMVEIMNKMGYAQAEYKPDTMLDEISQVVPFFAGVKWEKLGDNGKQWPVRKSGSDTKILHLKNFHRGKGKFHYFDFKESEEINKNGKEYPYIITTNRELEHYNSGTMTRRTGNVKILTEDVLLINAVDAQKNLINDGDMVCVESPRGKVDIKAKITAEVKPGILSTTFHFPEVMLNIITSDEHDSEALCPEYKIVAVNIRKSKGQFKNSK
ncbi:MAG: molybdopterin-dependent oxidoreductase, partial [Bacteroidetes bacterium]|nr:molybdopterin-dependent oxidoreductase [Bacteroidota bacterium]